MTLSLQCKAFSNNEPVPQKHTEDGADLSPPLSWSDLPRGTKELALILDDPDAPTEEPWVHWVIYNIPATAKELPEAIPNAERVSVPPETLQGKNTWGTIGYRGPAPPPGHGTHHYHFKLYALNTNLPANPGMDKNELLKAMEGHILDHCELVGTYQR